MAAGDNLRSLAGPGADITHDALELLLRNDRTHLGVRRNTRPYLEFLSAVRETLDDLVEDFLVCKEPRAGRAKLSRFEEDGLGRRGSSGLDVGIGENNHRRLSTPLQRAPLQWRDRAG